MQTRHYQPTSSHSSCHRFFFLFPSFPFFASLHGINIEKVTLLCITLTGKKEAFIRKYYDLGKILL